MIDSSFEGLPPENAYHGDPSLPYFKYDEETKERRLNDLISTGMDEAEAEDQITREEIAATNKLAEEQVRKEQGL